MVEHFRAYLPPISTNLPPLQYPVLFFLGSQLEKHFPATLGSVKSSVSSTSGHKTS